MQKTFYLCVRRQDLRNAHTFAPMQTAAISQKSGDEWIDFGTRSGSHSSHQSSSYLYVADRHSSSSKCYIACIHNRYSVAWADLEIAGDRSSQTMELQYDIKRASTENICVNTAKNSEWYDSGYWKRHDTFAVSLLIRLYPYRTVQPCGAVC